MSRNIDKSFPPEKWNKKWKLGTLLSRLDVEILFAVGMNCNTNKLLHEKLRKRKGKLVPKPTISRHTKKLEKLGLLKQRIEFNVRPFELTERGKNRISIFLTRGVDFAGNVRGHRFGFVCKILRAPKDLRVRLEKGGWVVFYPKNREAHKNRLWGCTVIFNPRSVQFMPPEVYASSGDAAFDEAYRLVLKVREHLNSEYPGLVLGPDTAIYGQEYARMFDPLAMEYLKTSLKEGVNLTYKSDRLAIDLSKKLPELETIHKAHSKDDLRKITEFYEDLVRTDFKIKNVETIEEGLLQFTKQLELHYGVLNKIGSTVNRLSEVVEKANGSNGEVHSRPDISIDPTPFIIRRHKKKFDVVIWAGLG